VSGRVDAAGREFLHPTTRSPAPARWNSSPIRGGPLRSAGRGHDHERDKPAGGISGTEPCRPVDTRITEEQALQRAAELIGVAGVLPDCRRIARITTSPQMSRKWNTKRHQVASRRVGSDWRDGPQVGARRPGSVPAPARCTGNSLSLFPCACPRGRLAVQQGEPSRAAVTGGHRPTGRRSDGRGPAARTGGDSGSAPVSPEVQERVLVPCATAERHRERQRVGRRHRAGLPPPRSRPTVTLGCGPPPRSTASSAEYGGGLINRSDRRRQGTWAAVRAASLSRRRLRQRASDRPVTDSASSVSRSTRASRTAATRTRRPGPAPGRRRRRRPSTALGQGVEVAGRRRSRRTSGRSSSGSRVGPRGRTQERPVRRHRSSLRVDGVAAAHRAAARQHDRDQRRVDEVVVRLGRRWRDLGTVSASAIGSRPATPRAATPKGGERARNVVAVGTHTEISPSR